MSETPHHIDPPDDDTLAAEYVLGVLSAAERGTVAQRIARDRGFAARVESWQLRLVPWSDDVAPVQPSLDVWTRISAALPPERAPYAARARFWDSLALWRSLTVAAGALAVVCLVLLVSTIRQPVQPALLAAIDGGGHHHFVATIDPARDSIAVVPAAYVADASRVPELWLIPPGGKPHSLGLLSADRTVTLSIPAELRRIARNQAVLAVSLEPPGGSTTGSPTGPVIAQGRLTNL
jgi:anti-sigma-K factor RskA